LREIVRAVALIALVGLLATVLVVLWEINREGVTVHLAGQVKLAETTTRVAGEVSLVMSEPVNLIATGPENASIPANLLVAPCPQCGGSMVPIRWNPLTGEIEWSCLECNYSTRRTASTNP